MMATLNDHEDDQGVVHLRFAQLYWDYLSRGSPVY